MKGSCHIVNARIFRNGDRHFPIGLGQCEHIVRAEPRADRQQHGCSQHTADIQQHPKPRRKTRTRGRRFFVRLLWAVLRRIIDRQVGILLRQGGLEGRKRAFGARLLLRSLLLGRLAHQLVVMRKLLTRAFQQLINGHVAVIDLVLRFVELKVV